MDIKRRQPRDQSDILKTVLISWGMSRVILQIPALCASYLRPLTDLEERIAVWPPVAPLGEWLARVLFMPWQRWDVIYYIWIATQGYALHDGTAQFHPLFPWLAKPLVWLGVSPLLALLLISTAATVVLLIVFLRLAQLDLPLPQARDATLVLSCSPFAFALFLPYPESLFLVWAVLCLYWSRRQQWVLAGLAGALATLTRQQGLFLLLPVACEVWEAAGRDVRRALRDGRAWLGMALPVIGYGAWVIYRAFVLQDVRPDWSSLHAWVYTVLISPSATSVVAVQTFMWPWQAFAIAWRQMLTVADLDVVVNVVGGVVFIALAALAWRHLRLSYRVYIVSIIALSFAYQTGTIHPYMGLLRHLLLAFPIFVGLGPIVQKSWARVLLLRLGVLGQWFLLALYWMKVWVP